MDYESAQSLFESLGEYVKDAGHIIAAATSLGQGASPEAIARFARKLYRAERDYGKFPGTPKAGYCPECGKKMPDDDRVPCICETVDEAALAGRKEKGE